MVKIRIAEVIMMRMKLNLMLLVFQFMLGMIVVRSLWGTCQGNCWSNLIGGCLDCYTSVCPPNLACEPEDQPY